MKHALAVLVALTVLPGAVAQTRGQAPERDLYVTVLSSRGLPIQGLTERDFLVREDGQRREVLRAEPATEPMQIDILVDTSAASRSIVGDLRRGVEAFVAELRGNELSLIAVGGARSVITEPTTDLEQLKAGIEKLASRPDTATYLVNSLKDSARDFEDRSVTRPVAVVVTTNGVDFSDQEPEDVVTRLRFTGAVVHVVVIRTASVRMLSGRCFSCSSWRFPSTFSFPQFPSWASRARDLMLDIGPRQTGGHRLDLSAASALPEVLSRLGFEIASQYHVVYAGAESLVPPRTVEVGVSLDERVTVRSRRRF